MAFCHWCRTKPIAGARAREHFEYYGEFGPLLLCFRQQHCQITRLQGQKPSRRSDINPPLWCICQSWCWSYPLICIGKKQVGGFTAKPGKATGGYEWPRQPLVTSSHAHILSMQWKVIHSEAMKQRSKSYGSRGGLCMTWYMLSGGKMSLWTFHITVHFYWSKCVCNVIVRCFERLTWTGSKRTGRRPRCLRWEWRTISCFL